MSDDYASASPADGSRTVTEHTLVDEYDISIDESKIREFARAIMDPSARYTDRAVAIDEGFRNIPAPLTFTVTAGHHRDALAAAALLGMEMSRVVVGEVLWEYRRPLVVGDRIRGRRVVAEVRERQGARGGRLRLATLETRYHDQTGTLVLLQREILIETERTDE